jgi:hypothetical protein
MTPTPTAPSSITLQEATKARGARKITIINLGLEPQEAVEMGLDVEDIEEKDRQRPVAGYVPNAWKEWLQTHRVELNAMTTPQFIEWLDGKMAGYEKLIPPTSVLEAELVKQIEAHARAEITERILQEAGLEDQVAAAVAAAEKPSGAELERGIRAMFGQHPEREWRGHIIDIAD